MCTAHTIPAPCPYLLILLNQTINVFILCHPHLLTTFSSSPCPLSSPRAAKTTSIQEVNQSYAIMLKTMPSLSWTWRRGPSHLFVVIVCPSALGSARLWAGPYVHLLSTGCCMSMERMFLLSLLLQYLKYFQYSKKGATAGLVRTLMDWRVESCQIWCSS